MSRDEAWIEEARQAIRRTRTEAEAHPPSSPLAPTDVDTWRRLCQWRANHPRTYLADGDVPADLRGLLGPAAAATRAHWQSLNLLPLYRHPRYGWRLAEDWEARLARLGERPPPHRMKRSQMASKSKKLTLVANSKAERG